MKKILLALSIFLLTGCYENSGYITKSCSKEENYDGLSSKTSYVFTFREDNISEMTVTYDYHADVNTISSIRSSLESQNMFVDVNYNVLINDENNYKIQYNIDMNNKDYWDKFDVVSSRTELVQRLKQNGFKCE